MRSRFNITRTALGVGALLLILTVARAQTPCPKPEEGREHRKGPFREQLKTLNLTAAQTEQLTAQRKEKREAMKNLRESLKAKRRELREELYKENTDKAKIESIASELKKLNAQRIDRHVQGILQMKAMLTPEQFKKLSSLKQERMGRLPEGLKGKGRRHGHDGDEDWEKKPAPAAVQSPQAAPGTGGSAKD